MENMIRMNEQSKPDYLNLRTDELVDKVVLTTDKVTQKNLYNQAITVLELLRDKKVVEIEESDLFNEETKIQSKKKLKRKSSEIRDSNDLERLIPQNIQKYLKQGRILRVYGEDGVCRSMHFFLSKDMTDIKCKHPKENFVKQKWIIPIHQVKEIKHGYDKKSPIAKSGTIFSRPPNPKKCFAVFGPTLIEGPKNFHCVCANNFEAKKWFDYLTLVFNEYKKILVQNLRQDKRA